MGKPSAKKTIFACISLVSMSFMVALVPLTLSIFIKEAESDGFYGEVSLRSYFDSGDGTTEETAFVITRPRHMYNLSRLQGLGVFDSKTYFRLGLIDDDGNPYCYLDDSSSTRIPYLDMSSENSRYDFQPVNAIGSEAMPFYGEFDGQGLEIKDLNVYADPEDAGLFGYTAHGSKIKNLFLDNITIHATGYTSEYSQLYGQPAQGQDDPFDVSQFTYIVGTDSSTSTTFARTQLNKVERLYLDATDVLDWNGSGTAPTVSTPAPIVSFNPPENLGYKYKLLVSGDFLKEIEEDEGEGQSQEEEDDDEKDVVGVDLFEVFNFFRQKKELPASSFPIEASSSVSFVASMTDSYGLDHSKVVMTLDFHFSLNSKDSKIINMVCRIGKDHGNNIGLIVGHCDGSITDCYVHDGQFKMNNGGSSSDLIDVGTTYYPLANGSNYGLIGLVGGTVHNIAAQESSSGTGSGKDIGVLDFTTVYEDIIDDRNGYSFNNGTGQEANVSGYGVTSRGGIIYKPSSSRTYQEFLRKNNDGNYVTYAVNTVSFNGQKVIANPDLGIFTIATDQASTGMGEQADNSSLPNSMVSRETASINSKYIYYATGEYQKDGGISFADYRDSIKSDHPTEFHPGYHFPHLNEMTTESFEQRNKHQNYVIRFEMDVDTTKGERAKGTGFYFSDVKKDTTGGSFLSKYFEHILVDQNSETIYADDDDPRSGVMLKNVNGDEIEQFTCSFATPDLSYTSGTSDQNKPKRFCVKNTEFGNPAANSVNFEIKTAYANVTVVAGLADRTKPAALGVYRIDNVGRTAYNNDLSYIPDRDFENPDYAFFMPTDDHLAYFDYKVDENDIGHIGVYDTKGSNTDANDTWKEADSSTSATVPKDFNYSREHAFASGKNRLYAHTFKLPEGRYCLGSATGLTRGEGEGLAKIYYLCAQGQTDGQLTYEDNAFNEENTVKNVDFTKQERYTLLSVDDENNVANFRTNFYIPGDEDYQTVTTYNANSPYLECQRCYVSLANNDRSLFEKCLCNLEFAYVGGKFVLSTASGGEDNILRLVVNSYGAGYGTTNSIAGLTNTTVHLITNPDSTGNTTIYTP